VGQDGNLRRIGNPPAGSTHNSGDTPSLFAARRYAGQVVNLPAGTAYNAGELLHHLRPGANNKYPISEVRNTALLTRGSVQSR